jgi:hypothetical protein
VVEGHLTQFDGGQARLKPLVADQYGVARWVLNSWMAPRRIEISSPLEHIARAESGRKRSIRTNLVIFPEI